MLKQLQHDLKKLIDPAKAAFLPRFFKTGKGQYGEGDVFLGITVPKQRSVAKKYKNLSLTDIDVLLESNIHEYRLTALFILISQFEKADDREQKKFVEFYIQHLDRVNNWDLVDSTAPKILGTYLLQKDRSLLYDLVQRKNLWAQRMAIIATQTFIKHHDYNETLKIAEILLRHNHDLIHKAVGWMLREIGKRNQEIEETFLKNNAKIMPRTMLRYAIEKFAPEKKLYYLGLK